MEGILKLLDDAGLVVLAEDGTLAYTEAGLAALHLQLALLSQAGPRHVRRSARRLARDLIGLAEGHDQDEEGEG